MVTVQRLYKRHPAQWVTASPLWDTYLEEERKEEQPSAQPAALAPIKFRQPTILRFTSDTFMEDFLKVATTTPERLHYWRVQPEIWRIPAPTPLVDLPPDDHGESDAAFKDKASGKDLTPEQQDTLNQLGLVKLYQPANQRFYLVTANLVCSIPGLPDRMLNLGRGEKVSFVMRRLIKSQDAQGSSFDGEYAFVDDSWQFVGNTKEQAEAERLYPAEQQYPMFPVTYYAKADGHKRRMFAGLVPVSNREKFVTSEIKPKPESSPLPDTPSKSITQDQTSQIDQLMTVLDMDVFQPWDALIQKIKLVIKNNPAKQAIEEKPEAKWFIIESLFEINKIKDDIEREKQIELLKKAIIKQRDQIRVSSCYILLDFISFIKIHLSSLWEAIINPIKETDLEYKPQIKRLLDKLKGAKFQPGDSVNNSSNEDQYYCLIVGKPPLQDAKALTDFLHDLEGYRLSLEAAQLTYDSTNPYSTISWPPEFLLSGTNVSSILNELIDTRDPITKEIVKEGLFRQALTEEVRSNSSTKRIPLIPLSQKISQSDIAQASKNPDEDNNRFLIRCVFECPNCPPSLRQVISEPTLEFQMASYFDPDAPVRPVRIPLPVDTTPAGLRKFAKNTMFAISDSLACQIELARKLTLGDLVLSVLPWPFHKDLPDPSSGTCKEKGIDIGKLCTLSIPIITICALILLIIMVLVLDQIFKWVPYLIFCLPLPGLKAKNKKEETP